MEAITKAYDGGVPLAATKDDLVRENQLRKNENNFVADARNVLKEVKKEQEKLIKAFTEEALRVNKDIQEWWAALHASQKRFSLLELD